jgi:hypothetical protein
MPSYSKHRAQVKELSQLSQGLGEGQNTTYTLFIKEQERVSNQSV